MQDERHVAGQGQGPVDVRFGQCGWLREEEFEEELAILDSEIGAGDVFRSGSDDRGVIEILLVVVGVREGEEKDDRLRV